MREGKKSEIGGGDKFFKGNDIWKLNDKISKIWLSGRYLE